MEVLDDLVLGGLKVIQAKTGYRFSIDAVLLTHFCSLEKVKKVVDLGTGSGVIPLLLTYRKPDLKITGIEIQAQMVDRARRSVQYNRLEENIKILNIDIKELKNYLTGGFADLVVVNPPFFKQGEGKISLNQEQAIARHELKISMAEVVETAAYLLNDGGRLALVQRADRLVEIINLFSSNNINLIRMRLVYSHINSEAKLVLIEGQKNSHAKLKIMSPLIIYQPDGEYSEEIKEWYG
ncbi:MAG TPA: tRNA1(Val) (adenine(37)-N6)-methyltransferase [Syntrophomonadaceae bacterium]|nr:tRNA1(Val) (adenine(37)-N6)-methyltransferase [Syntrophomonadaceae bacterium]